MNGARRIAFASSIALAAVLLALGRDGDLFASSLVDADADHDGAPVADASGDDATAPPQLCRAEADCPEGRVCSGATGECVEKSGALCELPLSDDGPSGFLSPCVPAACGAGCDPDFLCGPGLVCVLDTWTLPPGATEHLPARAYRRLYRRCA